MLKGTIRQRSSECAAHTGLGGLAVAHSQRADENARAAGHMGVFLTLTCPSRFHAGHASYDGSTPRDAAQWLRTIWARARAELARGGVRMYGVRIAEPHRDGCPHWHAMLWFETSAAADGAVQVFRKHWLREDGDEPGAQRHRVSVMRMGDVGGAGYVSKYINKEPCCAVWARTWGIRPLQTIGAPFHDPAHGLCE
ncbi:hypothetical protein B2J88_11830 [Rhodococcus sp. SRB_17]|uniref:replication endonuclease n=1 Tax=Acidovorax sp. SRB_24 TaxID=1962700 RepID=UPI00145EC7EB|nr:replication endonuclease [Acidovorax sp. SRB_24]NMM75531.1 hypothetical protein [Acidovorax sp. SRB_24]NMM85050.1 hypothetical protein [Rhodococcus sp. SRB_17]